MKIIVNENQRGLLFKNGKFIKPLKPGKYSFWGKQYTNWLVNIVDEFKIKNYDLNIFTQNKELANELEIVEVKDETLVLHFVNGVFKECLTSGNYAFWKVFNKHEFKEIDTRNTEVASDFPKYLFAQIPQWLYQKVEVAEFQKALLYFDKQFVKLLDSGTYYFWNNGVKISYLAVDTRQLQMDILGQEIMTLDKVSLRINFVCSYKITDYINICTEIDSYEKQIHVLVQLALREYVGNYKLDELLENKEQLSNFVFKKLKENESEYFVQFTYSGVKDIILPGEMRNIMNMVLIAEKQAQANVITRREEVASTRSLLNTAKLMEENKVLYKLKELEYLEKICDNVGNISVSGGTDLLSQLTNILKGG